MDSIVCPTLLLIMYIRFGRLLLINSYGVTRHYLFSVVNRNKEAEDLQNALHLLEASLKDSGVAVNEEEGRSLIGTGSLDSSSLDGLTPDDLLLLLRTTGSDEVNDDTNEGNGDGIPGDNGDESPGPSE